MVHHLGCLRPFNDSIYYLVLVLSYDKNKDAVMVVGVGGAATPGLQCGTCYILVLSRLRAKVPKMA